MMCWRVAVITVACIAVSNNKGQSLLLHLIRPYSSVLLDTGLITCKAREHKKKEKHFTIVFFQIQNYYIFFLFYRLSCILP